MPQSWHDVIHGGRANAGCVRVPSQVSLYRFFFWRSKKQATMSKSSTLICQGPSLETPVCWFLPSTINQQHPKVAFSGSSTAPRSGMGRQRPLERLHRHAGNHVPRHQVGAAVGAAHQCVSGRFDLRLNGKFNAGHFDFGHSKKLCTSLPHPAGARCPAACISLGRQMTRRKANTKAALMIENVCKGRYRDPPASDNTTSGSHQGATMRGARRSPPSRRMDAFLPLFRPPQTSQPLASLYSTQPSEQQAPNTSSLKFVAASVATIASG